MQELEITKDSDKIEWNGYSELKKLVIRNPEHTLSPQIGKLPVLQYLQIEGVAAIPDFIFDISSLTEVHLSGKASDRKFTKPYPDLFSKLPGVTTLSLGNAAFPFPSSVWKMSGLTSLALTIEDCRSMPAGNFSLLTNLQDLSLTTNHFTDEVLTEIASLPYLKRLTLDVLNVNKFPLKADLSALGNAGSLEELVIRNSQLTGLPVTFRNLKNLRSFCLEATSLRRFTTSLDLYFENLPENLVRLHLDYIGFSVLPENIGRLQNLKSLYLTSKQITKGYENLLLLPQCEQVYFRFYRSSDTDWMIEKIVRNKDEKTKYSELVAYFEKEGIPLQGQKKIIRFMYKDSEAVDKETILRLLGYPNKRVREEAFIELTQWVENPFVKSDFTKDKAIIAITGKIKQRNTKELAELLRNQGYTFQPVWDQHVTHVVLSPTEAIHNPLLYTDTLQLALPEHLMELLERENKPFLKQQEDILIDNLVALLFSNDESNMLVALQMMLEGGIPENRFMDFVICFLMKNFQQKQTKQAFRKVIEKHCSVVWQHFLKSNTRRSILEDYNHTIIRHELVDLGFFLKKGLEIGYLTSKTWFVYFFDRVVDFKSELAEPALRYLIRGNTMDLLQTSRWQGQARINLAKSLSRGLINMENLTGIEELSVTAYDFADMALANYSFFANLKTLTNLKGIYISGHPEESWIQDKLVKAIEKSTRELPAVKIIREQPSAVLSI